MVHEASDHHSPSSCHTALLIHFPGDIELDANCKVIVIMFNHPKPFKHWCPEIEAHLQANIKMCFLEGNKDWKLWTARLIGELSSRLSRLISNFLTCCYRKVNHDLWQQLTNDLKRARPSPRYALEQKGFASSKPKRPARSGACLAFHLKSFP